MSKFKLISFLLLFCIYANAQPISLHPENNHYFLYKGKATILLTSAEHYGAVLNKDFDYERYLQTLHSAGMNYTRIFTGSYVEIPGIFNIKNNSLAPATGSFITPWQKTDKPGLLKGTMKVDLSKWNQDYFNRLKNFISLAENMDIIVEVTLFCSTYSDDNWKRNLFNPGNNVNNISEGLDRKNSNTLNNGNLKEFQLKYVEKMVTELNDYNNVIFEIQNEPWVDDPEKVMRTLRTISPQNNGGWYKWAEMASDASLKWQNVVAEKIVETEKKLPKKHLIAQNFTNFKHSIEQIDPNISIINFHYAWPEAVWMNYAWGRPIIFDESGFDGSSDTTYLRQAWQFMLSGGSGFNNLDYSFFVGKEDGTGVNNAPGGGSTTLRKQLYYLKTFIESFNLTKMQPDFEVVKHSPGMQWQAISDHKKQYAIIFTGINSSWIKLNLPRGKYNFQFISPFTGQKLKSGFFTNSKKDDLELSLPQFEFMVALKIVKK